MCPFVFNSNINLMGNSTRIPRGIDEYHDYMGITSSYFTAGAPTSNGVRLGILPEEITQWGEFGSKTATLYPKYIDKKNSRTTAVKDEILSVINETVAFDKKFHILDRIASSLNATVSDLATFNIKSGVTAKAGRSIPQSPISELVTTTITPIGGGSVNIKCYSSTGQRAGILEPADSVQYLYMVGSTPPASAEDDGLKLGISTKGILTLQTGPGSTGKNLYIYFRWFNSKHSDIAGPWSSLQTTLIL